MLILSRFTDEEICIGDNIRVMIVDVDRKTGRVKLGIAAPKDVQVDRLEVYLRKHDNDKPNNSGRLR